MITRSGSRRFLYLVLTLLLIFSVGGAVGHLKFDKAVPQGGISSFTPDGNDDPIDASTHEVHHWIVLHSGNPVAYARASHGWNISYSNGLITVSAPATAVVGTDYQARYREPGTLLGQSESVNFNVVVGVAPAIPTNLVATMTSGHVSLTWTSSPGATSYNVLRSTTSGTGFVQIQNVATASATDSTVINGTTYYYMVQSVNGYGTSRSSNQVAVTPMGVPTTLNSSPMDSKISLAWDATLGAASYNVLRSTTDGSGYTQIQNVTTNSATDATVTNGTTYYYVVTAVNTSGQTGFSNQVGGTPFAPSGFEPSTYLQQMGISNDCLVGNGSATVTVGLSQGTGIGVTVQLSYSDANVTGPGSVLIPRLTSSASFVVNVTPTSPPKPTYIYATFQGWTQKVALVALPDTSPLQVTGATATAGSDGVWLDWNLASDGVLGTTYPGYLVQRRTSTDPYTPLFSTPAASGKFVDTTGIAGTQYVYRIDLMNSAGAVVCSSPEMTATYPSGTPAVHWSQNYGTLSGTVQISGSAPLGAEYELYANGQLVAAAAVDAQSAGGNISCRFNTTSLPNGTYSLVFASDDSTEVRFSSLTQSVVINNDVSQVKCDGFTETSTKEYCKYFAMLPSDTATYSAQLTDDFGKVIRTWNGSGAMLQFAWDGTDSNGNVVDDGTETMSVQLIRHSGTKQPGPIFPNDVKVGFDPTFLALTMTDQFDDFSKALGRNYRLSISSALRQLRMQNSSMRYVVFEYSEKQEVPIRLVTAVKRWLALSVVDFYMYGHGYRMESSGDDFVQFGLTTIWNNLPAKSNSICIPALVGTRPYNFVWLDCCSTVGFGANGPYNSMIEQPNARWQSTFNAGMFVGWNGFSCLSANGDPLYVENVWGRWRRAFWRGLGSGICGPTDLWVYAMLNCGASDTTYLPWGNTTFPDGGTVTKQCFWGAAILP